MALFRSEILNQDFFKRALQEAEKTKNVDILEITVGDPTSTGLQEMFPLHLTASIRGREREFDLTAKGSSGNNKLKERELTRSWLFISAE